MDYNLSDLYNSIMNYNKATSNEVTVDITSKEEILDSKEENDKAIENSQRDYGYPNNKADYQGIYTEAKDYAQDYSKEEPQDYNDFSNTNKTTALDYDYEDENRRRRKREISLPSSVNQVGAIALDMVNKIWDRFGFDGSSYAYDLDSYEAYDKPEQDYVRATPSSEEIDSGLAGYGTIIYDESEEGLGVRGKQGKGKRAKKGKMKKAKKFSKTTKEPKQTKKPTSKTTKKQMTPRTTTSRPKGSSERPEGKTTKATTVKDEKVNTKITEINTSKTTANSGKKPRICEATKTAKTFPLPGPFWTSEWHLT